MSQWIDLSHDLTSDIPVFPGDPDVRIRSAATVATDGFEVHSLHLGTHSGTHVDAPAHLVAGGRTVEMIEVEELVGDAVVLFAEGFSPGAQIRHEDVADQLEHGLGGARIVLVATGWDRHWGTEEYLDHPVLEPMFAQRLLKLGARVIGVDTLSPDSTHEAGQGLPVHEIVLGSDRMLIENLRGLTLLPARVEFLALPLRLPGLDGSPVRAVARVLDPGHL